jgi:hypothetical protein
VRPHPARQPVIDRADVQIDRLDAAEGAFHRAEGFLAAHCFGVVEGVGGQTCAHDIDTVGGSFFSDRVGFLMKLKAASVTSVSK